MKHSEIIKLKQMLLGAHDGKLVRILQLVERSPDAREFSEVLEALRPRLAQLKPPRPLTLERLLVLPFEDLLVAGGPGAGTKGMINRSAVGRLIEVMLHAIPPDVTAAARLACAATNADDTDKVLAIGATVWGPAGRSLAKPPAALANGTDHHGLLPQFALAAQALGQAPLTVRLMMELPPKPFVDLGIYHCERVLETLRSVATDFGAAGIRTLVLILVSRAARIDEIMGLLATAQVVTGGQEKAALSGQIADFCVDRCERLAKEVRRHAEGRLEPTTHALINLVNLVESIGSAGEGVRRSDIDRAIAEVGRSVSQACRQSLKDGPLADSLKTLGDGAANPDWPAVEDEARALAQLRLIGRRIGLGDVVHQAARAHVDNIQANLLHQAKTAGKNPAGIAHYNRQLINQARLVEILAGSEAAIRLVGQLRIS